MARVFANTTIRELAGTAAVPVINGLCDLEHPCQALADLLTIWESAAATWKGGKSPTSATETTWRTRLLLAARGREVVIACPEATTAGRDGPGGRGRWARALLLVHDPGGRRAPGRT